MSDIFGKNVGDKHEGGLIDCTFSEEFDLACANAREKWSIYNKGKEFVQYFLDGKSNVLRKDQGCGM